MSMARGTAWGATPSSTAARQLELERTVLKLAARLEQAEARVESLMANHRAALRRIEELEQAMRVSR